MIVLDDTTTKLQLTTDSALATSVSVSYQDETHEGLRFVSASQETAISSATTTDILAVPATSKRRVVTHILITNTGAGTQTCTLLKDVNGTDYQLGPTVPLGQDEALVVDGDGNFTVLASTGIAKSSGGGGGGDALTSDPLSQFAATTSAQLRGVLTNEIGTGFALFAPTPVGASLKFLRVNAGETDIEWAAVAGGGDALKADPLSQFAATTSLQLKGVISDETGSGALVFADTPTLVTPVLGTPTSGTLTNCTGLPTAGLVDDAVTYAKIQDVSATDKVLGRSTAGAGIVEEIACTSAGRALIDDADASAQRTTLGLGGLAVKTTVATGDIDADAVTYAKIQNVSATDKVLGRSTAGAGDVEEIACTAAGRALIDDADASAQRTTLGLGGLAVKTTVATGDIDADAVTYAKIQNVSATDKVLGRSTAGAGDVEEIACTSAGRALIDDADAAAQRTTLGLGTIATLAAPSGTVVGTSDTQTLTNKRITKREQTLSSASTVTPNASNDDIVTVTALAAATQLINPTGSPTQGQSIIVRIKDNGSARGLTYESQYRGIIAALPSTTRLSKTLYMGFIYNSTDTKWDLVALADEV